MKLTELFLNRFLYRDNTQNLETKDSVYESSNVIPAEVPSLASGGAAQDINTSNVFINGAQLEPGTIPQTILDVSNWGWGQTCAFSSTDLDTVSWGSGIFTSADGNSYSINSGNTGNMTAKTYIYLDLNVSDSAYQITTTPATSVGVGKVLIAVAQNASSGNLATYNLSEATQIVGDNILANSINASKITTGQLIVGTNVGLGTAEDSAGVTTIIGNTVTTEFINALSVVAGSVAAENITGTYITGKTITGGLIRTSTSGDRVVIGDGGDEIDFYSTTLAGILSSYTASTRKGLSLSGGLLGAVGGGGANILLSSTSAGDSSEVQIFCQGLADILVSDDFVTITGDLVANNGISLGGVTITDWSDLPSGATALSGLSIDTNKDWGRYDITNIGSLEVNDYIYFTSAYLDNVRTIYFETGRTANPNYDGQINYYDGTYKGFRGMVDGWLGQFDMTAV